jgi:hypothetical protein
MAGMTREGHVSHEMGMHTEQLRGRTQQVFFAAEEEERFVYPFAFDVDFNKRAEFDAAEMDTKSINLKLRELMSEGHGTIVIKNPGAKHSLGVGILNRLNLIIEGSLGYFGCGLIDGPNVRIRGRVGWSCAENMMAGTLVVEKNLRRRVAWRRSGVQGQCRIAHRHRHEGRHHPRRWRHGRLLRLHDAARAHGGLRQCRQEPGRFDV